MMRSLQLVLSLTSLSVCSTVAAEPALIWLSASSTNPNASSSIVGVQGQTSTIHIWAQPATTNTGGWNAVSNPFKSLQNLSLNLKSDQPVVDFLDEGIKVYNPGLPATTQRFQFVADSDSQFNLTSLHSASEVMGGTPDEVQGMAGFSPSLGPTFSGIGPTCEMGVDACALTTTGSPAWLIASVDFLTLADQGTSNFFLQLGASGMNHAGEFSVDTFIKFSSDPNSVEPTYHAGNQLHRQMNLPGEAPDLMVHAVSAISGDYNGDGSVNAADFSLWRDTLGSTSNLAANGNGNASIDPGDYEVWRDNFGWPLGSGSGKNATAVPEPTTFLLLLLIAPFLRECTRSAGLR